MCFAVHIELPGGCLEHIQTDSCSGICPWESFQAVSSWFYLFTAWTWTIHEPMNSGIDICDRCANGAEAFRGSSCTFN